MAPHPAEARSTDDDRRAVPRGDADVRAHHDAIYTLARAAELHDADTGDHVVRIRLIVERIAARLGYDDPVGLGYDAMLHDVGKLMIPPDVLRKPGRLTDRQRQTMESHTILGQRLLSSRPSMQRAALIARSHHERMDGSGYPDGLAGAVIPIEAKITAVADVLDALVADRCYKSSWSYREALDEVCALAPAVLDPVVIEALRACDEAGALADVFPPGGHEKREPRTGGKRETRDGTTGRAAGAIPRSRSSGSLDGRERTPSDA